jgi:hypothetical protein
MDSLTANRLNGSWSPRISCRGLPEADVSRKNIVARLRPVYGLRLCPKQSPWKRLAQFSLSRERNVANIIV